MNKTNKIKIYDCFTFFNELDLLEIRLRALDKIVDYFVIVEANRTFSGAKKESLFLKNEKRFEKWKSKIRYEFVNLPDFNLIDKAIISLANYKYLPKFGTNSLGLNYISRLFIIGRWKLVFSQRDKIINLLSNAKNEDIILFSDLDEIPLIKSRENLNNLIYEYKELVFRNKSFIYYLNGFVNEDWLGTRAVLFEDLLNKFDGRVSFIRENPFKKIIKGRNSSPKIIFPGGWHFTYMGDTKTLFLKTKSTAERNTEISKDKIEKNKNKGVIEDIKGRITAANYVDPKKLFPMEMYNILKDYPHLIKNIKA